jgi:multiple sugar transport system ATP-binding protein
VPDDRRGPYTDFVGKSVILGVRPEDIHDPNYAPVGVHQAPVEAQVEVTELMGNEVYLYLKSGDKSYVARVDPRTRARIGDKVQVAMNLNNMHLFDKSSEGAIR